MKLEGKVALIAGAGSIREIPGLPGNGRATAILFAQEGAKVVVADIRPRAGEKTVDMIREKGGEAVFVQGDVTKAEDAKRMVETAVSTYGKLDILHNNVGIALGGSVVDTSEEDWDRVITTNLKGIFLVSKYAIPHMIKNGGGSIINTSSVAGMLSHQISAYATSKAGVIALTRCMAMDFARSRIRVNCIVPGTMDTPMVAPITDEKRRKALCEVIPLGHMGLAQDVAYGALYLASDEASYVTGTTLVIDGGLSASYHSRSPAPRP
jgi:NAD(P)-dependent dehydrogenase (short-subunit alcohol dehydrogenase family)